MIVPENGNGRSVLSDMAQLRRLVLWILAGCSLCAAAEPVPVVMLSGSDEYDSQKYLGQWKQHLEQGGGYVCTLIHTAKVASLPALVEALPKARVFVTYTHRMPFDDATLQPIKDWCAAGKPIIGLRTASHGYQRWLEFDQLVLGGAYDRHGTAPFTPVIHPPNKDHAILAGVAVDWQSRRMYANDPGKMPAKDGILMTGVDRGKTNAYAWVHEYQLPGGKRGRVFYCSGGVDVDFASASFVRMMDNALTWVQQPPGPGSDAATAIGTRTP